MSHAGSPFHPPGGAGAGRRGAPDPISVEIIRNALESLAEQMTETMTRTSYSPALKEGKDCSSSLFDARGRLVAEGANVPIHLNALGPCPRAMLAEHFPPGSLRFRGAGKAAGGMGLVLQWQVRGHEALFSHTSQRSAIPPQGLFGGRPGAGSRWVLNEGTEREQVLAYQTGETMPLEFGDTVTLYTPGGGGYGDPLERDPERVRADVLKGFVSREAARREYGVVLTGASAVDEAATAALRAELRGGREAG